MQVCLWAKWSIPAFCNMKWPAGYWHSSLDGILSIDTPPWMGYHSPLQMTPYNLSHFSDCFLLPTYSPVLRGALWELSAYPKNVAQWWGQVLELVNLACWLPGYHAPHLFSTSTLIMSHRRLVGHLGHISGSHKKVFYVLLVSPILTSSYATLREIV